MTFLSWSVVCVCPGWILIDRNGKHFGSILHFLRDGTVSLPKGRQALLELLNEAKYYLLQGLVELCQNTVSFTHMWKQWEALEGSFLFRVWHIWLSYTLNPLSIYSRE